MIELRTLGALDMQGDAGESLDDLCARPKLLAILIYVTLARPRGFFSQDVLLSMFWPDSDTHRAQLSLRQSMHLLRRSLGEEIVVRRGRTEIGILCDRISCDALDFDAAIASGNLERAAELYRGELLPDLHAPYAPEFEQWISAERLRLHEAAIGAVSTLAVRYKTADDVATATVFAKRWIELAPGDKSALEFAASFAVDAAAQTGQPEMVEAVATQTDYQTAETRFVSASSHSNRFRTLYKIAAIILVAVSSAAGLSAFVLHKRSKQTIDTTATRIAIFPFTVRGSSNFGYLREGMVDLLSAKLDGAGGQTTVDARSLLSFVSANKTTVINPENAREMAAHFSAGRFVLGSVIEAGGRIEIMVSLYDQKGRLRESVEGSAVDEAHVMTAVDKIARDLLAAQFTGDGNRLEHVAAITTASLPALKAFLEGERAVRTGQRNTAVDAFKRAVHEDSTFALAHYRLSTEALWNTDGNLITRSIVNSMRYIDRLPQHERLALEARRAAEVGATDDADRQYRDLVAAYPDDADAWNQLGELIFHTGPWRGHPFAESRGAFERVLKLHPDDANALLHLARISTFEKRSADVISIVGRALALKPEREALLELRGLRAAITHDAGERAELRSLLRANANASGIDDEASLVAWRVATYADDPREGATIIWAFSEGNAGVQLQVREHSVLAHMAAARGRWNEAARELASMESNDESLAAETRANLELSAPEHFSATDRARTRELLAKSGVAEEASHVVPKVAREGMQRSRHAYLVGALALADGDTLTAQKQGRALLALGEINNAETELARHLAHQLNARALWRRGDASAALREVEIGWPKGSPRASLPLYQGEAYTQAHERFFRGQLLQALGRDSEALRWYGSVSDDQGAGIMLSAPVHLARARIAERHADSGEAAQQYREALALWADADVALSQEMQNAKLRLAALEAGATRSTPSKTATRDSARRNAGD